MMLVQIVMLNLLIAFMAQLLGQLRANAQLMAKFERTMLVIQQEHTLMSRRKLEERRAQHKEQRGLRHTLHDLGTWLGETKERLGELLPSSLTLPSQEDVGPRWLHVLLPSESLSDNKKGAAAAPSPKATEKKHSQAKANDELKQWLTVQLGRLEARLLEQGSNLGASKSTI